MPLAPRAFLTLALVACLGFVCQGPRDTSPQALANLPGLTAGGPPVDFARDVKPVLDARCVVCHACYDAPCQLQLGSHEGILRGATRLPVYDTTRLANAEPTRLGVDAHGAEAWRAKGFHSVLEPEGGAASALVQMLALGAARPFEPGAKLPDGFELDIDRELHCSSAGELDHYAEEHPDGGMPYGTAPLTKAELRTLAGWLGQGAPASAAAPARVPADVAVWEAFLNGESAKERVVARYLYEHWFVAHLTFDGRSAGPFFRVVRSRTAPGAPVDEIASVRPYDDPGGPFWYRLRPVEETIVHKTHLVYVLGPARLSRLRQLFLGSDWKATRLPSYAPEEASNPFVAFAEIPARARYQFLLDDAQFFVDTFIRGPVCRGQVAVDVIEDHFFIAFADPDRDLTLLDRDFLPAHARLLDLPAEHADGPSRLWLEHNVKQRQYMEARGALYDRYDPKMLGPTLDWIWDGEGWNRNAYLTVFRNFDNATVRRGFVGEIPKTAWVMDYPIFERIYYNLVAGYDVYGKVGHQVATRLYMDHLRMQSEIVFLGLLPSEVREPIRASWYVGATEQLGFRFVDKPRTLDHGTQIRFETQDPKRELLEKLIARSRAVLGSADTLNRCATPPCDRTGATLVEIRIERALQTLAAVKGPWVQRLPEVSLLRVRGDEAGRHEALYSLVHNAAHTNVAFLFDEEERRLPDDDTVTVVRGHFGSYPNFFFEVELEEVEAFAETLRAVTDDAGFAAFVARFGVRRTDPRFWEMSDWLREDLRRRTPMEAGLYDLARYVDP
jgi:hypothetical protein